MSDASPPERLQKALARAGLGSRREIEGWIRAGRLTVNGVAAELGMKVGARDQVKLDGRPVRRHESASEQVFVVHRSPGENLREAREGEVTDALIERLPKRSGRRYIAVSPMPHMDGGLELVTSDGELAVRLQRAVRLLPTTFSVRVHGEFGEELLARIAAGELDSGARVRVERCEAAGGEGSNRWYEIEAVGASGREIRQLFERQGALVSRVLRTRLGSVRLDRELARGQFRRLEASEVAAFMGAPQAAATAGAAKPAAVPAAAPAQRRPRSARPGIKGAGNRTPGRSRRARPAREE